VRACESYFAANAKRDVIHAATCLDTGATLVSDDPDFEAVAEAGVIHRLTITEAVRRFL
jgi:predicted nucleic acid-binding protein